MSEYFGALQTVDREEPLRTSLSKDAGEILILLPFLYQEKQNISCNSLTLA